MCLLILLAALWLLRVGYGFFDKVSRVQIREPQRAKTLSTLLSSLWRYFVYGVADLLILQQFVNITPLLAGAGFLGLVVGIGAQSLIRDVITGFFILFEDQFHVGDFVEINGQFSGRVEELGLRLTAIREWSGRKFYIANSEIKTLRNYSRHQLRAIVTITFPFEGDPQKIRAVLEQACREIGEDYDSHLIKGENGPVGPPQIYGVTDYR